MGRLGVKNDGATYGAPFIKPKCEVMWMANEAAVIGLKYEAKITADWLRKCVEDDKVADLCYKCPFDDGVHNCMDHLHNKAADLLDKLAAAAK